MERENVRVAEEGNIVDSEEEEPEDSAEDVMQTERDPDDAPEEEAETGAPDRHRIGKHVGRCVARVECVRRGNQWGTGFPGDDSSGRDSFHRQP
ncbi:unnamed protein product [Lota lota]